MDRKLRELFAVQSHHLLGEAEHELAVRDALSSGSGIDARRPQPSEVALFGATVCVCMHARFHDTSLRNREETAGEPTVSFCSFQNFVVTTLLRSPTFDACHKGRG